MIFDNVNLNLLKIIPNCSTSFTLFFELIILVQGEKVKVTLKAYPWYHFKTHILCIRNFKIDIFAVKISSEISHIFVERTI